MDIATLEVIRLAVGLVILAYVGYCLLNQKVWIRGSIGLTSKTFAWGTRGTSNHIHDARHHWNGNWDLYDCKSILVVITSTRPRTIGFGVHEAKK